MSDLVSRKAAINALRRKLDINAKGEIGGFYNTIILNNIECIERLRSADAVPVVRCKDCKYYKESVALSPQKFCFRMKDRYGEAAIGYNFADDDFCSYGKRSEE